MQGKFRKKTILIILGICILITAGFTWYFYSANDEYGYLDETTQQNVSLGMKPEADIAANILSGSTNTQFADYLKQMGYDTFLSSEGPFTVFVPTDEAYGNVPVETREKYVNPKQQGYLRQVLQYHVVEGRYLEKDLKDGMKLTTVQGEELTITRKDGQIAINGYSYIQTYDVLATNGVIHVVTNYLFPPTLVAQ